MGILKPSLGVLPQSQRLLWPQLRATPECFVLYGGTALALRLGHRESIDFDFFCAPSFAPLELVRSVPYLKDQAITQQAENTLSCEVDTEKGAVKISFFGGLSLGQIDVPDIVEDNTVAIASLRDIFGMKCATVPQRSEIKDYLDIHALITGGKLDLSTGIASAMAVYGRQYNGILTLQALSYFEDLPSGLPDGVKTDLAKAVKSVSLKNLPAIVASGKIDRKGTLQ